MNNRFLLLAILFIAAFQIKAQDLLDPTTSFSHKKISYITLKDGTEIKGRVKDIDRKKGLIDYIKLKDIDGKKHKLKPDDISHMYLLPSNWQTYQNILALQDNLDYLSGEKIKSALINDGYIYFEQVDVKIKKKDKSMLMQLLNPTYSKYVKVYHDPRAKETFGVGMMGVDVVGGVTKSYYVSKNGEQAYKLTKKDYEKEFLEFWGDNEDFIFEYPSPDWKNFNDHIHRYTELKENE